MTPVVNSRPQLPVSAQDANLPVEVADWLASLADELLAPATRRAYRSAVRLWAEYAASVGASAMPPDEAALLAHVRALSDSGASLSRIRLLAAALEKAGAYAGVAQCVPPSVRMAIGALAAKHGRADAEPKQATGVRADALLSVAMAAQRPRPRGRGVESDAVVDRRAALDVAIVLVMRDGLLRVSECAALLWSDVALNPDGSATAVVRRTKTKSTTTAYFAPTTMAALVKVRSDGEPRVIPLSPRQIARRFKAACAAAGVVGATSHGARVGMAQDLAAAGTALPDLMSAGGWRRPAQAAHYVRHQAAAEGPVARFYKTKA